MMMTPEEKRQKASDYQRRWRAENPEKVCQAAERGAERQRERFLEDP